MWEGNYGTEPFDLRLTVLRLFGCLGWIGLITLLGTLLFGGGYYVRHVVFGEKPRYEQTITCKLEYTNPPVQSGDYYINEMTWNTYVHSSAFETMLWSEEPFLSMDLDAHSWAYMAGAKEEDAEGEGVLSGLLSAKVASDIHVPSFTVSCLQEGQTESLSQAVQSVVTDPWVTYLPELKSAQVIDVSEVTLVYPDVRPLRAVILSAVLSCFFAVVFFLLREIGADSVWLPATIRRRYGIPVVGTLQSVEFAQNAGYLFKGVKTVSVCSTESKVDLQQVTNALQEKLQEGVESGRAQDNSGALRTFTCFTCFTCFTWKIAQSPLTEPGDVETLRQADGVLVVVSAGLHAGKPLEYLLEFLQTQEIKVTAALLWEADERLIKSYYVLPGGRK